MDIKFEHEMKTPRYKKVVRELIIWVLELAVVIVLAYVFVNQGLVKAKMVGDSMETTLQNADSLIINQWLYRFTKPKRFDIIAYTQNSEEHNYLTIKRIVGLPGETIQIKEGAVFVNGEKLEENVVVEPIVSGGLAEEPIALEENEYFVLGDNRNNSEDSRFANLGNIVTQDIVGKVWIRTNSFSFVHGLNHKEKEENPEEGEVG